MIYVSYKGCLCPILSVTDRTSYNHVFADIATPNGVRTVNITEAKLDFRDVEAVIPVLSLPSKEMP